MSETREVVITGVGLVSSLGEGGGANWQALSSGAKPVIDATAIAPYPVHPMVTLDLDRQIPKKGDQRQMEPWQRIGVYAAGLALSEAGVAGKQDLLGHMDMIVAAGGGERDVAVDEAIMTGLRTAEPERKGVLLNERLSNDLRPTLFLAQLSNLLAGNVSIVHGVTGSSRTFMGEEAAGLDALRTVVARIRSGQSELGLVGGAYSAPRWDMSLTFAFAHMLLQGEYAPVWQRKARGGGVVMGSIGAFLVVESRAHAEARGARPLARIASVMSSRSNRAPGAARAKALEQFNSLAPAVTARPLGVISGATGVEPVTGEERAFLGDLARGRPILVRASGSLIGHGLEAAVPANVALAALALDRGGFYPPHGEDAIETASTEVPEQILVTSFGHWRGEGLALIERA